MAISMAVFGGDPFTHVEMIRAIEKRPYTPMGLGAFMGFAETPVFTDMVGIKHSTETQGIVQTTLRGAPIEMVEPETEGARVLKIPRIALGDKLFAHELANMNPAFDETEEMTVAAEIARRQEKLIRRVDLTVERMRLHCLNGIILDKDGSTLLNLWTEFGVTPPAAIDLNLDAANPVPGQLRRDIQDKIVIPLIRAAQVGDVEMEVRALCGDQFYSLLTTHSDVERTYLNQAAAAELRGAKVFDEFLFAGVRWKHYRGTDDNSTVAVPSNSAKIFPFGVPEMFRDVLGPANEFLNLLGQRGRRYTPFLIRDRDRDQWVQPEIYSYPLEINTRPDLVLTATV